MAIDYSKWDKIELSDDSDIEVHPNVDKRSFIRWKQQSIHETRMKRNQDIKNLETQISMYSSLNKRVDKLLAQLTDADMADNTNISKFLNANFDKTEKTEGDNIDPDIPSFNEMVEDLFEQLRNDAQKEHKDPRDGSVIREMVLKHRAKIDSVTQEAKTKLEELYKEKSQHISSEDIHTGFDSSFMNKKSTEEENKIAEKLKAKQQGDSKGLAAQLPDLKQPLEFINYQDDVMKLAPETEEFAKFPINEYGQMQDYLLKHMQIISEQQKDALMMKAFEYQFAKDEKMTYQVIHQSELLSYIREIYDLKKIPVLIVEEMKQVIQMFFTKVIFNKTNQAAKQSFLDSVRTKVEHVKNRVKIMEQEQKDDNDNLEGVETIQLKSLDESTELEINLPDFNSEDPQELAKVKAFSTLPETMKQALKTQNLDKINEVFAKMPIKEAEEILDTFNEAEIIGVKAILENEDDFKHLQEEYNSNQNKLHEFSLDSDTAEENRDTTTNTTDVVN